DGRGFGHEHCRANTAGHRRRATQAAGAGPASGDANERNHAVVGVGSGPFDGPFDGRFAAGQFGAEHGREHVAGGPDEGLGNRAAKVHNVTACSRIPTSFSLIWSAVNGFRRYPAAPIPTASAPFGFTFSGLILMAR